MVKNGSKYGTALVYAIVTDSGGAIDVKSAPERFDVVVTDEAMPGLTGTGLARMLRCHRPDLPIVLLSGFSGAIQTQQPSASTAPAASAQLTATAAASGAVPVSGLALEIAASAKSGPGVRVAGTCSARSSLR